MNWVKCMHDWSLAESIIQTVKANSHGKVTEIDIVIGELQGIEPDIIVYAIKELSKNTNLKKAKIDIKMEEARLKCSKCKFEWKPNEEQIKEKQHDIHHNPDLLKALTSCPNCQSTDFDILKGMGFWVEKIKVSE